MEYYKLSKDGPTVDNILKCFNTWDFSTYETIEDYVNAQIILPTWGDIGGTLANQTDLMTALNSKANDADVIHLTGNETIPGIKTFIDTIYIKESVGNFVTLKCLSSNKIQIGSGAGVSTTLRIGDARGGSHRGQVEINADGEITCLEDDYGVTAYLQFPSRGTSSQRATLATLEDCSTIYKHTLTFLNSLGGEETLIILSRDNTRITTSSQLEARFGGENIEDSSSTRTEIIRIIGRNSFLNAINIGFNYDPDEDTLACWIQKFTNLGISGWNLIPEELSFVSDVVSSF